MLQYRDLAFYRTKKEKIANCKAPNGQKRRRRAWQYCDVSFLNNNIGLPKADRLLIRFVYFQLHFALAVFLEILADKCFLRTV